MLSQFLSRAQAPAWALPRLWWPDPATRHPQVDSGEVIFLINSSNSMNYLFIASTTSNFFYNLDVRQLAAGGRHSFRHLSQYLQLFFTVSIFSYIAA